MQLELLLAGLALVAFVPWVARLSRHPRWLLLLGGLGLVGCIGLLPVWLVPVWSDYGSCGSVLLREHPAGDTDGVCNWLAAEQYNATLPVFLPSIGAVLAAGAVASVRWLSVRGHQDLRAADNLSFAP